MNTQNTNSNLGSRRVSVLPPSQLALDSFSDMISFRNPERDEIARQMEVLRQQARVRLNEIRFGKIKQRNRKSIYNYPLNIKLRSKDITSEIVDSAFNNSYQN